jgi:DNA-binding NtrC family response regulator
METPAQRPTIMIIDDDEIITTTLRDLFRIRTEYQALTFTSPQEALSAAEGRMFDLVISDYLMPGMDGITFLSKFKEAQPQAIRILLTGYADKESAIRAINQVGLYQYVEKPWDNDELLMIVGNALEKASLLRTLDQKIAELQAARSNLKDFQHKLIRAFI